MLPILVKHLVFTQMEMLPDSYIHEEIDKRKVTRYTDRSEDSEFCP